MQIIKKNILAIICGVVALMSIAAIYWPISGWYQQINEQLQTSKRTNDDLNNLKNQGLSCRLPIVDPQKTEAPPLDGFPTHKVYLIGVEVVKKIQQQSAALMTQAIADNRRSPIDPNALPTYRTGAARATFKDNYYLYLEALKGRDMLNALPPATPKDVTDEHAARWNEWLMKLPAVNNVRDPQAVTELQAEFNQVVVPALPASVARTRANACTMYISAGGLYVHPGIPPQGSNLSANLNDVWAAQIAIWIQTDICSAIAQTNKTLGRPVAGRITVPTACVKRLVRTNINPAYVTANGLVQFASRGTADMGGTGMPIAINPNPGIQPTAQQKAVPTVVRSFQSTFTGRVSNEVYEVVHFSFTVDIEAANCRALLANLTNGRFVTVLHANMTALDRGACQAAGLLYGTEPVVQMTVTAESVFFHDWTRDLMPTAVATALEQQLQARSQAGR
ncbi:MAG: hypothetical protein ABSH20_24150 [Tepidisphaeraceae bacterium]|jgi:hypothetical protein